MTDRLQPYVEGRTLVHPADCQCGIHDGVSPTVLRMLDGLAADEGHPGPMDRVFARPAPDTLLATIAAMQKYDLR